MRELIKRKRDGFELSKEELAFIINGFVAGEIPDYQLAAFLMAVYFKGLNYEETANLTDVMMRSGALIDLSEVKGIKVDKHSTGGVGDKTTLVLGPLVAAAGVRVAKMSGRGLGFTGGTIDKLESIPGLNLKLTTQQFMDKVKKNGIVICGQSEHLVPADKKLYALRDVTSTVDNISLISSSIMSKKLACGADAIVIDIKVGSGAFMKTEQRATELAKMMIGIGTKMNKKVIAVLSSMQEPLGYAVGNALEVKEAIDTLKGQGPKDLTALCLELGSQMLVLGEVTANKKEAVSILEKLINSGAAFEKFKTLIQSQGGDIQYIEQPDLLPNTSFLQIYKSNKSGYLKEINARNIGLASMELGAGRQTKDSEIDYGAGILLQKKVGEYIQKGQQLAILYSSNERKFAKAKELLDSAFITNKTKVISKPLILKTISS